MKSLLYLGFMIFTFTSYLGLAAQLSNLYKSISASKATASYIKPNKQLDELIIIGYPIDEVTPIAGFLNVKIYYPQTNSFGSFVVLKKDNLQKMTTQQVLNQVYDVNRSYDKSILLIINYPLETNEIKFIRHSLSFSKEAEFTKSLIDEEKYYLYQVRK